MIFLLFRIGLDRYAMEASRVVEVLPNVKLKAIPQALPGIAGVFNYHGRPVPEVDLSAMALGQPAKASMSTRLLVVHYSETKEGEGLPRLLGVIVEMATEIGRYKEEDFEDPGTAAAGASYLGPVVNDARGIVQWVRLGRLLSPEVRDIFWRKEEIAQ